MASGWSVPTRGGMRRVLPLLVPFAISTALAATLQAGLLRGLHAEPCGCQRSPATPSSHY